VVGHAVSRRPIAALALLALACSPQLDWRELRSDEGRFVAMLPGRPAFDEHELAGRPGSLMRLWWARAGGAVYGVGYVDPPRADANLVAATRDALVGNIAGHLTEERDVIQGAARGREFRAEGPDALLAARLFVAGGRLYEVVVVGKKGALDAAGIDTFFSSFRMTADSPPK
jgi:hypothetical protein